MTFNREKEISLCGRRGNRDWNPHRAQRSPEEERGESILSASGSRATPFFFLSYPRYMQKLNSPERERALFTTRGRVYGCFFTNVVNAAGDPRVEYT